MHNLILETHFDSFLGICGHDKNESIIEEPRLIESVKEHVIISIECGNRRSFYQNDRGDFFVVGYAKSQDSSTVRYRWSVQYCSTVSQFDRTSRFKRPQLDSKHFLFSTWNHGCWCIGLPLSSAFGRGSGGNSASRRRWRRVTCAIVLLKDIYICDIRNLLSMVEREHCLPYDAQRMEFAPKFPGYPQLRRNSLSLGVTIVLSLWWLMIQHKAILPTCWSTERNEKLSFRF